MSISKMENLTIGFTDDYEGFYIAGEQEKIEILGCHFKDGFVRGIKNGIRVLKNFEDARRYDEKCGYPWTDLGGKKIEEKKIMNKEIDFVENWILENVQENPVFSEKLQEYLVNFAEDVRKPLREDIEELLEKLTDKDTQIRDLKNPDL